jgi:hypothetical protein
MEDVISTNNPRNNKFWNNYKKIRFNKKDISKFASRSKSGLFPGRDAMGGYTANWGLDMKEVQAASAGQMFKRSAQFAFGGTGYKREALMNSFGLLSKQQKMQTGLGGLGQRLTPLFMAASAAYDLVNGNGFGDTMTNGAGYFGANVGFRIGQSFGFGVAKAAVMGTGRVAGVGALRVAGLIGGGLGAATIGGLAYGAAVALITASDSDNFIIRTADKIRYAELNTQFVQTDMSLTHRQRALEQISKSAMNNRGSLLGNEASILALGA